MNTRKLIYSCCAAGTLLLSSGWLDKNFAKRTELDVDAFRHPAGKEVLLTIDAARLGKATKSDFQNKKIKLGFTDASGKEREIAFASNGVEKVDRKMRISFTMPQEKGTLHLYFDGNGKGAGKTYPDALNGTALDLSKYKNDGSLKLTALPDGGMNIRQKKLAKSVKIKNKVKSVTLSTSQVFPLKPEYAGMPVTLVFDGFSRAKAMYPFSVIVQSLDAKGNAVGEPVCDIRWTTLQSSPEKPFNLRQAGKLDPRAKFVKLILSVHRANEARAYDVHGKLLKDFNTSLANMDITRLELIPGYHTTVPGANSDLYTEGVAPGTSAVKLAGYTSLLYNNFPMNVWAGGQYAKNQSMYYFPVADGTAEFYLKFDEIPQKEVILFDNTRNRNASFLRLEYNKGKLILKMNGYDKRAKSKAKAKITYELVKSVAYDLQTDKWTHFAITWDNSGVNLFVDGKKILHDSKAVAQAKTVLGKLKGNLDVASNLAEYTCIGADGHRYYEVYGGILNNNYFKGAADELRISKVVRYTDDFTPATSFTVDKDTCALFSYEKNFDGLSAVGSRWISGSIFAGDVPPRADTFTVEDKAGNKELVRYVPKAIPDSNMPEYHIAQTSYPVLPSTADFKAARVDKSVSKTLANGEKIEFKTPEHTVPYYIEIKAVNEPVKAPFLRHAGEIDARSFADIAESMDFSDNPTDHAKARKIFDFLVRSTDYYTFPGAEFVKHSNMPMHAAANGLVAINSYTCFQCGPLNGIASGLFTNGLGFVSTMTFGNGHLFQQVMIDGRLRVFDLSAQKYWPSRDQDDAASLDELEKDVYLFYRTLKGQPNAISHFFRMGQRGLHSNAHEPRERLDYTLYPGESFRYYPGSCGYTQDIKALNWRGQRHSSDTWKNMQEVTGADVEVGRAVQRLLPHVAQGVYKFDGKVAPGAFSNITSNGFTYRIDSPYTIIHGVYSVPDKNASFQLSRDNGKTWKDVPSKDGVCTLEFELRGRHAGLLKVNTSSRNFKAMTVTQMSARRQTGLARAGKNSILFTSDGGKAEVTVAYRERAKDIVFEGGFYSGTVPGLERQLFTLVPGKSRTIKVSGVSAKAKVTTFGGIKATLADGKLTITAPSGIEKGVKYVIVTDGKARKAIDVLVSKKLKEFSIKDFKPFKGKAKVRKVDDTRPQNAVSGAYLLDISDVAPGKYVIFTLTRRDHRVNSVPQAYIYHGKVKITAARYRNPSFDFYKAEYGPYKARWNNPGVDEKTLSPWSRLRWDTSTGKDTYPRMLPLEITIKGKHKPLKLTANTADCYGVILLPSEDRDFMYFTIANLHHISRADWLFNGYLDPIY